MNSSRDSLPRVVFVIRSCNLGGAERQVVLLANELHASGDFQVAVLSLEGGDSVPRLLDPGVGIHVLSPEGKAGKVIGLIRFLLGLRRLKADILLPFTDWPNKLIGTLWPSSGAAAWVWNQRDEGREISGGPLEKAALRQLMLCVANSSDGIDFLMRKMNVAEEKILMIPNMVVAPRIKKSREEWRRELGIAQGTFVALMAASLSRFKDHDTLLDAWPGFQQKYPDARLLLAGKALDRAAEIEKKAANLKGVLILGEVEDIGGLLGASDLLVHSSEREGSPNAVYEAMALGLPVLATRISGTVSALGEKYPWLVSSRNPAAMAEALEAFAGDRALREEVGRRNHQRSIAYSSPEQILPLWTELINSLLRLRDPG